jgi:hypothetical protein
MREDFLHYIWKYHKTEFESTAGEYICIEKFGEHNTNAGPDFINARVIIGDQKWAGNIEIHINASDWNKHGHQNNNAYNNVILHVVYNNDCECKTADGKLLTTLEIKKSINKYQYQKYLKIIESGKTIPCANQIHTTPEYVLTHWLERCAINRLEEKSNVIEDILVQKKNNWEELCYTLMARNFGFKTNADAFQMLANCVSLHTFQKNATSQFSAEALLLGSAGFLNEKISDDYALKLQSEFNYLSKKNNIHPLDKSVWKFLRMRPANFPTIRIVQFAALMQKNPRLFSVLIETKKLKALISLLNVTISDYWDEHYVFEKKTKKRFKKLGQSSIENVIINTIVPLKFVYGKHTGKNIYQDDAIKLLEELNAEENSKTKAFYSIGFKAKSAMESQALIFLKTNFCDNKLCLSCEIGHSLLQPTRIV